MFDKRLHILLYGLLVVYIGVSLGQHYHFKKEIAQKEQRIDDFKQLISKNDEKIEQVRALKKSYWMVESLLDSLIEVKQNDAKKRSIPYSLSSNTEGIPSPNSTITKPPPPNPVPIEPTQSEDVETPIETNETEDNITEKKESESLHVSIEESEDVSLDNLNDKEVVAAAKKAKRFFFKEITRIYSNIKKPREVRSNDKYIWIEIDSDYGNYKNPLWKMIRGITINGTYVDINDIKENIRNSPSGFIATYYIEVRIPRDVVFVQRNQIILTADTEYIGWLFVHK